jgi:methionyl-tRNA formyltransferase
LARQNQAVTIHQAALRIVFAGSPAAAIPSLRTLAAGPHEVVGAVTRDDAPLGRKRVLTPTPVAAAATELRIPVLRANRIASVAGEIASLAPDLGVVVAYGGLIREPVLSTPRLGWINLHFSLLPRWRGAAPVQRAIMAGDRTTGVAVFQLVAELDAGPVFGLIEHPIGRNETAGHLLEVLAESGADLLADVVDALADGSAVAIDQVGEITLAPKLELADGRLDWDRPASELDARIRATTPEPGAFTGQGETRLKILDAAVAHDSPPLDPGVFELRAGALLVGTATEPLHLVTVLPAGKRTMSGADWWRGRIG